MNSKQQVGATSGMQIIFWLLLIGSLTLFFNGFLERQQNPNMGLTINGDATTELVLQRNRAGHYVAPGLINGVEVTFLLDTGATDVSVPEKIATQAGLQQGRQIRVGTANGVVAVYHTLIETIQLGHIQLQKVQANINPHMHDDIVLLGMSFMKDLEMTQRDGTLTLRLPQR